MPAMPAMPAPCSLLTSKRDGYIYSIQTMLNSIRQRRFYAWDDDSVELSSRFPPLILPAVSTGRPIGALAEADYSNVSSGVRPHSGHRRDRIQTAADGSSAPARQAISSSSARLAAPRST